MALDPTAIVPSAKYIAIFDNEGNCKILQRPTSSSLLGFDGNDAYWMDGSVTYPIKLPNMQENKDVLKHIVGMSSTGRLMAFVGLMDKKRFLSSDTLGNIHWEELSGVPMPPGIPFRPNYVQDGITPVPDVQSLADTGVVYIDVGGNATAIENGPNGQVLTMVSGAPQWKAPFSGSVSAGGASVGFNGINGSNTNSSTVNIKAAQMVLTNDAGDKITVNAVNVLAQLTAPLGVGGLDVGTENSNVWYYVYVVSDGTNVGAVISLDGSAPDATNLGAYTYHFMASVFRNDNSGNIVSFQQLGGDFWIASTTVADPASITTALAAVTPTTALTTILPPITKYATGIIGGSVSAGNTAGLFVWMAGSLTGLGLQAVALPFVTTAAFGFNVYAGNFRIPIFDASAPVLYWQGHVVSTKSRVIINGYSL